MEAEQGTSAYQLELALNCSNGLTALGGKICKSEIENFMTASG